MQPADPQGQAEQLGWFSFPLSSASRGAGKKASGEGGRLQRAPHRAARSMIVTEALGFPLGPQSDWNGVGRWPRCAASVTV